jgi:hypothetical protein
MTISETLADVGVTVKLPPWPYANQLVQQFELFVGHDYHWYRRADFHHKLNMAFRDPHSPCVRDRVWLCQLFVVFALGASYFSCISPSIELYDRNDSGPPGDEIGGRHSYESQDTMSPVPSGAEFFEQALKLFKLPTEEYHVSHVEVLNLMVGLAGCRTVPPYIMNLSILSLSIHILSTDNAPRTCMQASHRELRKA